MLHIPILKYIIEIYLGIVAICIAGGKIRKENMEGLKTVQISTIVVTLLHRRIYIEVFEGAKGGGGYHIE